MPFTEIADILACSIPPPGSTPRGHGARARRAVALADLPTQVGLAKQRRVLDAFLAALAEGDLAAVVGLLHPDAVVIGDGGGKERTT